MNRSLEDLMQLALDGAATPAERARLEAALNADPAARRRYAELQSLFEAIGGIGEEAPEGLREDVLRALPPRVASSARVPRPWRVVAPRLALPIAAGVVSAVVLMIALRGGPSVYTPDGRTSGTMSGAPPRAFRLGLGAEGAALHVTLWRQGEGSAHLVVASDAPARVSLSSARGAIGFTAGAAPTGRAGMSAIAPDRLELSLVPGEERDVTCRWAGSNAAVRLRAEVSGGEIPETRLDLTSLPVAVSP